MVYEACASANNDNNNLYGCPAKFHQVYHPMFELVLLNQFESIIIVFTSQNTLLQLTFGTHKLALIVITC